MSVFLRLGTQAGGWRVATEAGLPICRPRGFSALSGPSQCLEAGRTHSSPSGRATAMAPSLCSALWLLRAAESRVVKATT